MKVEVGYKVKFINENLDGEVKTVLSQDRLVVSCSDGFDHEVSFSEVLVVGENNEINYSIDQVEISEKITEDQKPKGKSGFLNQYNTKSRYGNQNIVEVDLHLEQLVEFPSRLDDWQKLHTQMQHVKNCISAAREKRVSRVVFIHGVGTGVLKTELHNYISKFDYLELKEADFREYGSGATEVLIS